MQTTHGNLHLEIQTSRKSPVGILRTTFRENGQVKHSQHGRIVGCSLEQLKLLQLAFREQVVPQASPQAFQIVQSKEYGASSALLEVAKQLGLHLDLFDECQIHEVIDPEAPENSTILELGIERESLRGNWLTVNASLGIENGSEEDGMAGIYLTELPK